jgi:hypothetical protein
MTGGFQILARQFPESLYRHAIDFCFPFTGTLWATIAGMLVVISVLITVIETAAIRKAVFRRLLRLPPEPAVTEDGADKSEEMSFMEGFWFGFQTLVSSQENGALGTKFSRATVLMWAFTVIVLNAAYTATFTTILASATPNWVIGNVLGDGADAYTTLSAAVKACPMCISTQTGGAGQTYLNGTVRMDFDLVQSDKAAPFPLATDPSKVNRVKALMEEGSTRSVWIENVPAMKYITSSAHTMSAAKDKVCDWKVVGDQFGTYSFVFLYSRSLPAETSAAVDGILSALTDDLTIQSLTNQWFPDWPECLLIKTKPWRPLAPEDFIILFVIVGVFMFVGLVYRLCGDYVLAVEMHPDRHRGTGFLPSLARHELVKDLFGVHFERMEKPFTMHAMLSKLSSAVEEIKRRMDGGQSKSRWVQHYNSKKGVFYYVNEATKECRWTRPPPPPPPLEFKSGPDLLVEPGPTAKVRSPSAGHTRPTGYDSDLSTGLSATIHCEPVTA